MEQSYSIIAVENLRARMNSSQITIQALSDLSGVPVGTINNIFSGRVSKPPFDNIYALAKALDTSINEIMGDNLTQIVANDKIIDGYENRLRERMEMYESRLTEQHQLHETRVAELSEAYNVRLCEQHDMYDARLSEQKKHYDLHIDSLQSIIASLKRRSVFHIAAITALIAFALFLIFIDARIPDWGLIQYAYESMSRIADVVEGLV